VCGESGAQVLFRSLLLGYSIAYIPKGPIHFTDELLNEQDRVCQLHKAIFLKIEPFAWEPYLTWQRLEDLGWHRSESIQPRRTVTISLTLSSEEILAGMKQKTRYNIRLAQRKDVTVRPDDDVALFHRMMLTTGERDTFGIHSLAYYQRAYECFAPLGACTLLIAAYQGRPLAGLMAFAQGDTAWYFYGASTDEERNRMPTYLLQWEAIQWAKQKGCTVYDLWGVPDHSESELEETFLDRSDGLWGVYRFKRGFGGQLHRTIGTWDRVYQPLAYKLYQMWTGRRQQPAGA